MRTLALAVALCAALIASRALAGQAQSALEKARADAERLQLEQALVIASQGLEAGDASPEEFVELWALSGRCHAILGNDDAAAEAFARALEIDPALLLPPGTSPKLLAPFQQARQRLAGTRLRASPHSRLEAGRAETRVDIQGDVLGLTHSAVVFVQGPSGYTPVRLAGSEPPLGTWSCSGPPCSHFIQVQDRAGNILLRLGSAEAPLILDAAPIAATAAEATRAGRPLYARPAPYLIAGAVALAASGALTYSFLRDQARLHEVSRERSGYLYREALELEQSRGQTYPWMLAAWGMTAGLGAVSLALAW